MELQGSRSGLNRGKQRTAHPDCHAAVPGASPVPVCRLLGEPALGASPRLCHAANGLLVRCRVAVAVQGSCLSLCIGQQQRLHLALCRDPGAGDGRACSLLKSLMPERALSLRTLGKHDLRKAPGWQWGWGLKWGQKYHSTAVRGRPLR